MERGEIVKINLFILLFVVALVSGCEHRHPVVYYHTPPHYYPEEVIIVPTAPGPYYYGRGGYHVSPAPYGRPYSPRSVPPPYRLQSGPHGSPSHGPSGGHQGGGYNGGGQHGPGNHR